MQNLQDGGASKVATVPEVSGGHHVLGVEHLLGQLGDSDSAERVCTTAGQWCESDHEEVKTRERNHVDSQFPKIGVELTRESQAGSNTRHDCGDEVVEITIRRVVELECPHADVVEGLEDCVSVLLNFPALTNIPRCQYRKSRQSSQRAGGWRVWRCMARQRCRRSWVRA